MANTNGRRDDWRTTATPGGRAARTGPPKPRRRWVLASLVVALLGGLVVAFLVFTKRPVEPLVLALPVSEYHKFRDTRWPPNPWAEDDARGLRGRFGEDSAQAFQHQGKEAVTRELANMVRLADEKGRPLVVYVTALGTVAGGTPYLLPADARPDAPASWLTVDAVLDPVRRGTTPRLVILDVRPVRTPRAALPTADVNELIDAHLAAEHEANGLPLLVLTANTPAAGPLAIPAHRHTAFGLALDRGIRGAADGWLPNTAANTDVTARELAEYVREATHAVTAGTQRPMLYGHADDFRLVPVPPGREPPPDAEPFAYPPFLEQAWKDLDAARADRLHLRAPRAVRQQSDAAADAERWWRAGTPDATVQGRYGGTFTLFGEELKAKALAPPAPPKGSFARGRVAAGVTEFDKQVRAAADALRGVVGVLKSDDYAAALKSDPAKAKEALQKELGKLKFPPEQPFPPVAAAGWGFARERPDVGFIRELVKVLDDLPFATPLAELAALKLITSAPDDNLPKWPGEAVGVWLDATAMAEAAAAIDGRALPQVKERLTAADATYRKAVAALVQPTGEDDRFAQAVTDLRAVQAAYTGIRDTGAAIGGAWREVEEARAALADLADRYPHELVRAVTLKECSLAELTESYTRVTGLLRTVPFADPDGLKRATSALRLSREALVLPVAPPAADDPVALESALEWPHWTTESRLKLLARLHAATAAAVSRLPAKTSGAVPTAPPKAGQRVADDSLRDLRNRAELVRLWDPSRANQFRTALNYELGLNAGRFATLAGEVGVEVSTGVRRKFDETEADRPLLGWAIPPDDPDLRPLPPGDASRNPEVAGVRQAEAAFARWLADERYAVLGREIGPRLKAAADRYAAVAAELKR